MFFSPLNSFNDVDLKEVEEVLENAKGFIRSSLGKKMKIKRLPELCFEEDKSEYMI